MCEGQEPTNFKADGTNVPILAEECPDEVKYRRIMELKAKIGTLHTQLKELTQLVHETRQNWMRKKWKTTARSYDASFNRTEARDDLFEAKIDHKPYVESDVEIAKVSRKHPSEENLRVEMERNISCYLNGFENLPKNQFCASVLRLLQDLNTFHITTLRNAMRHDEAINHARISKILDILQEFVENDMPNDKNQMIQGRYGGEQDVAVNNSRDCNVQRHSNHIRSECDIEETRERGFESTENSVLPSSPKNGDMLKKAEPLESELKVKLREGTFYEDKTELKHRCATSEEKTEELRCEMQTMEKDALLVLDNRIFSDKVDQLSDTNENPLTNESKQSRQIEVLKAQLKKYFKESINPLKEQKMYLLHEKQVEQEKEQLMEENQQNQPSELKNKYTKDKEQLIKKCQQLLKENEQLVNDSKQYSMEKNTLLQINKQLKNKYQHLFRENEKILKENNYYKTETKQLQYDRDNFFTKTKELMIEKEKITKEKEQVQRENKQHLRQKEELLSENDRFSRECRLLSKENQQHLKEKKQTSMEKEQISFDKKQLIKEKEQLWNEKEQHSKEKDELAKEKNILSKEKDLFFKEKRQSSRQKEQELLKMNEQLSKENKKLSGKNARLKRKCDELFNQVHRQIRRLQELEPLEVNGCNYLVEELDWLHREDCRRKDKQIDVYLTIISNLNRKIDALRRRSNNSGLPEL